MIFNMLRPQLCLVQAAIFPGILKANTKSIFWQGETIDLKTCKSVDLQTVCKFTKSVKLWTLKAISYTYRKRVVYAIFAILLVFRDSHDFHCFLSTSL